MTTADTHGMRSARALERDDEPDEPIACEVCGERVDANRKDARYCSNACRQKAYRVRRSEA